MKIGTWGYCMVMAATGLAAQPAAAAEQAPPTWARCGICHSVAAGKPAALGPNLNGVVGKKAGNRPGFAYSPAMKASGIVWTPAKLDAFLTKPQAMVPGTKMMFAGLSDAKQRAEVIGYLKGTR